MKTRLIALSAVAGLASVASAQNPTFSYSFSGLPASAIGGQTFTVTVLCGFTPGVGANVNTSLGLLPVNGLESGAFGITSGGAWSGLSLIAPVNYPFGTNVGTIAGGNVTGAIWGTGFVPPAVPSTVNPTPVWRGTFTMPNANATLTLTANGLHGMWAGPHSSGLSVVATGQATGATATIQLVPAPASLALLGLGGLVAARRRR